MRIAILDPGLAGLTGHHFDLDRRLVGALARRGHDVTVHGAASPRPDLAGAAEAARLRFHPTFRVPTYGAPPDSGASIEAYRAIARTTAEDLAGLPPADLWFWPTLTAYHLMAAVERAGPVPQIGGVWFSPRFPTPIGARGWAEAARQTATAPGPIVVGAYDEALCRFYRSFSAGLPIARLPCPHDGAANQRRPTSLRRIGFFGHQRAARGLDLLPLLVSDLLGRGFEVVIQDSGRTIVRKTDDPRLIVLPFVADFPAEIARCDLVVWPSRAEAYLHSQSGVVSECIATGVPIVLPAGCLPAEIAARLDAGVFFHDHSREAILDAVDEARQSFPAITARARAAAAAWRAENGTDRLADWIANRCAGAT